MALTSIKHCIEEDRNDINFNFGSECRDKFEDQLDKFLLYASTGLKLYP